MPDGHPFTVFEAEVRLYTVGANGDALAEQWLGCVDRITLEGSYRERAVQYHGRRRGTIYHEDEEWKVTLEGARLVDLRQDPPRPVIIRRNLEYAMVINWWDKQRELWSKRCYFGVKGQPANVEPGNINHTLRFSAEEMTEIAGRHTIPDFSLVRTGQVYYVDGPERTLLYEYEPVSRQFTAIALGDIPGSAEIITGVSGELRIEIGGVLALLADAAAGVQVDNFTAIGGTFLDEDPRLEFWVGNTRCASLSTTTLVAVNLIAQATPPGSDREIEVFNPGWLFSFTTGGACAPAFTEV